MCTRILRVSSSCPPIAHIHRRTFWKNHPSAVFSSKIKHKRQKTHTHIHTGKFYNFKYLVISKFTVFQDVIITDNLQNLRFYQRSSKNMNQNMFCTKSRLLTQKTVLKVLLFQFFLLVQTAVKLRNSQIHENYQLWYVLNYSNFF